MRANEACTASNYNILHNRLCFFNFPNLCAKFVCKDTHYFIYYKINTMYFTFFYLLYLPPSVITSQSVNRSPSIVSLTMVRSLCHPCCPAAPGLMCSNPSVLSYFTFRICECPEINSLGGDEYNRPTIERS